MADDQDQDTPQADPETGETTVEPSKTATIEEDKKSEVAVKPPTPPPARKTSDTYPGECLSPIPSGEELAEADVQKVIESSLEILKLCQRKIDEQKIDCSSISFMLLRIKESLDYYCKDYSSKLNTFLVHADKITAEYYHTMCIRLPKYKRYVEAVLHANSETIDIGGMQVSTKKLATLATDCMHDYYAAAMVLRGTRAVLRDCNSAMYDRQDIVNRVFSPMPNWIGIQDNVNCQLESIREQTFKILAYIDFLNQGESRKTPPLDLTELNKEKEVPQGEFLLKPE